jgi:preprotein translocase subunit YajC
MFSSLLMLLADGEGGGGGGQGSSFFMIALMIPMVLVFYLLVIRPQRRQEQQRQALVNSLKKNEKVLLTSGIMGTVVSVNEKEDEVVVRVDESCKLRVIKSSISRNLTQEEAAKKPAEPQKAAT